MPHSMMPLLRRLINRCLAIVGCEIRRKHSYPPDFTPEEIAIWESVRALTMTSAERVVALVRAVDYVTQHAIPGGIVECGVWKGGSMLAAARRLLQLNAATRALYLFDTFEGMTGPTERDRLRGGTAASDLVSHPSPDVRLAYRCRAGLEEVQASFDQMGYPKERVTFVKGPVEETVPAQAPDEIALLRLDTDWYASTRHELEHLYPRLAPGGVLIIDDYGHWEGARQAVDEYFDREGVQMLLARIDETGRIGVKYRETGGG